MSETLESGPNPAPASPPPVGPPSRHPTGRGTWRVSWAGLRTVAVLELRQRVRSTRWRVLLAGWAVLLLLLTLLIRYAVRRAVDPGSTSEFGTDLPAAQEIAAQAGSITFGLIVFLVLSLGALIAPALSSTSINGDRSAGVLATLQTTLLTPAEIALGKLLAAWLTSIALLVVASPFILLAYLDGGTPAGRLLTTLGLLVVMLLVVCAIGLGWSAVAARTASSTVLTYLTVAFLGLGLPILFALSVPLVTEEDRVTVRQFQGDGSDGSARCVTEVQVYERPHTERTWWVLAPNPYVVVADAAPRPPGRTFVGDDPLTAIRGGVREARLGPSSSEDWCFTDEATQRLREQERAAAREAAGVTWPYGLATDLAIGTGFVVLAIRRLRTPSRKLPRGTRVA